MVWRIDRPEALIGLSRVLGSYGAGPLIRALAHDGATPLALVAAHARRDRSALAWRDAAGDLTYAEVEAELRRRRPVSGPVLVRGSDAREIVLTTVAAMSAGVGVAVLGSRGGATAAELPTGRGVMFLTSGTTGAPRAHQSGSRTSALLPYLGMIGRLPRIVRPVVGSPSQPDHGHAFLLVMLTWALGGTYVQVSGPVGRLDILSGVPVQLADTLDRGWCDSARLVISGSDMLHPALAGRLRRDLGAEVWDAYGTTETGSISLAAPQDVAAGTVGRPLPGVDVRVADGRLVVRTRAATRDFTGDRGHLDAQGRIVLQGRADGRFVSGGEVVDPESLRRYLLAVPGVTDVTVRVVPHARFGSRLTAEVSGDLQDADLAALREQIRSDLGPAHVPETLTRA